MNSLSIILSRRTWFTIVSVILSTLFRKGRNLEILLRSAFNVVTTQSLKIKLMSTSYVLLFDDWSIFNQIKILWWRTDISHQSFRVLIKYVTDFVLSKSEIRKKCKRSFVSDARRRESKGEATSRSRCGFTGCRAVGTYRDLTSCNRWYRKNNGRLCGTFIFCPF